MHGFPIFAGFKSKRIIFKVVFIVFFLAENKNALVHTHIPGNKAFNWFGVLHRKSIWTRQFHRIVNQSSICFYWIHFHFAYIHSIRPLSYTRWMSLVSFFVSVMINRHVFCFWLLGFTFQQFSTSKSIKFALFHELSIKCQFSSASSFSFILIWEACKKE